MCWRGRRRDSIRKWASWATRSRPRSRNKQGKFPAMRSAARSSHGQNALDTATSKAGRQPPATVHNACTVAFLFQPWRRILLILDQIAGMHMQGPGQAVERVERDIHIGLIVRPSDDFLIKISQARQPRLTQALLLRNFFDPECNHAI